MKMYTSENIIVIKLTKTRSLPFFDAIFMLNRDGQIKKKGNG